jgi:hypothetical protein
VGRLLWADFGLPIYRHTYFVNNELIQKNPKLIERFVGAIRRAPSRRWPKWCRGWTATRCWRRSRTNSTTASGLRSTSGQ